MLGVLREAKAFLVEDASDAGCDWGVMVGVFEDERLSCLLFLLLLPKRLEIEFFMADEVDVLVEDRCSKGLD